MNVESLVIHYLPNLGSLSYFLIYLGMIFEGELLLFSTSFIARLGDLDIWKIFIAAFLGATTGDLLWYWLGLKVNGAKIPNFLSRLVNRIAEPVDDHLMAKPFRTIFVAKFIWNLNHLTLMRAGMIKIKMHHILKANLGATLLWALIVSGLGYFSGASFYLTKRYLRFAEITLLVVAVIFFILWDVLLRRQLKKGL